MKLVLIAGKARSGKTLAAKIMKETIEHLGKKAVITEYSKYIKLFTKEFFGWDGISEPKPRKFLQEFGTFVRHESKNQNYFIERMKEDLEIYQNYVDVVIISDVRLKEEIEEMKDYHPITIHVENNQNVYDLTTEEANHETEHALDHYDDFDYKIQNRTENEMKEILKDIIEKEGIA